MAEMDGLQRAGDNGGIDADAPHDARVVFLADLAFHVGGGQWRRCRRTWCAPRNPSRKPRCRSCSARSGKRQAGRCPCRKPHAPPAHQRRRSRHGQESWPSARYRNHLHRTTPTPSAASDGPHVRSRDSSLLSPTTAPAAVAPDSSTGRYSSLNRRQISSSLTSFLVSSA